MREIQLLRSCCPINELTPQISFGAIQIEVFQTFMSNGELMSRKNQVSRKIQTDVGKPKLFLWFPKKGGIAQLPNSELRASNLIAHCF